MNISSVAEQLVKNGVTNATTGRGLTSAAAQFAGGLAQSQYGGFAGIIAEKGVEALPALAKGIKNEIKDILSAINIHHDGPPSQGGLTRSAPPVGLNGINTKMALQFQKRLDTDLDGVVSKAELQSGLAQLEAKMTSIASKANLSKEDVTELQGFRELKKNLESITRAFDTIANIDGQAGVSIRDLSELAGKDGETNHISIKDVQILMHQANRAV